MKIVLRLCWWAYDRSLSLYPATLRKEFGGEMAELFRRQTLEAWHEEGCSGLLPVLWCGIKELFLEALCVRAASPELLAAALSLLCTSATFVCLLWALENPLGLKAAGNHLQDAFRNSGGPGAAHHRHLIRQYRVW